MELAGVQHGSNHIALGSKTKTTCTPETHPVCHTRCQVRSLKPQDLEQAIVLEEQGKSLPPAPWRDT